MNLLLGWFLLKKISKLVVKAKNERRRFLWTEKGRAPVCLVTFRPYLSFPSAMGLNNILRLSADKGALMKKDTRKVLFCLGRSGNSYFIYSDGSNK